MSVKLFYIEAASSAPDAYVQRAQYYQTYVSQVLKDCFYL